MTTITIPSELERPLAEAARRHGTTTEKLAIETLKKAFGPAEPMTADTAESMSFTQMAAAYRAMGSAAPEADAEVGTDFDDYPLY